MFLGSPRPSCRLSGKLGHGDSIGVLAFRSVSHATAASRRRVFPFRFPYHAVSPYRRSFAPFIVSGGGASGGKRREPSYPFFRSSYAVGAVSLCSPLCSFRSAKSAPRFPVSPGGAEGNRLGSRMDSMLSGFPCRVAWRLPVHRIRPSRPSPRLNRVAWAGRYGRSRHAMRDIVSITVGLFRIPVRRHA